MVSCDIIKPNNEDNNTSIPRDIETLQVPDDFNYESHKDVEVNISVFTEGKEPIEGIPFRISNGKLHDGGFLITQGQTDASGLFTTLIRIPAYKESITLSGFFSTLTLPITGNQVNYQFGGTRGRPLDSRPMPIPKFDQFEYLSGFDNYGVPDSLEFETISADLFNRINALLPEQIPLPLYHPEYFADSVVTNLVIEDSSYVAVTYIHEVASYKNALGFVVWDTNEGPPTDPDNLTHTIIFPNTSKTGSGGGLQTGDRVELGIFPPGKTICMFIAADGWTGSGVSMTKPRYYGQKDYNPETQPEKKQHAVLVHDIPTDFLILGFEDQNRESGFDEDFNDVIYKIEVEPIDNINNGGVVPGDATDTDGDGVYDVDDEYPYDDERAFNNYYPQEDTYGTLAYEDNWPSKGDYDFNDVIIDYNINQVTNASNEVVDVIGSFILKASGAGFHNGFAIQLPTAEGNVEFFDDLGYTTVELDNGCTNAVVILFTDALALLVEPPDASTWVNTVPDEPFVPYDTLGFSLTLSTPIPVNSLEYLPPYNPFIISDGERNREIHLPDYPPTSKMDGSLYWNTEDDNSNPVQDRYYKTSTNLPWAIHIPEQFLYPIELQEISHVYFVFSNWAESGGQVYQDWYDTSQTDRIDEDLIYGLE